MVFIPNLFLKHQGDCFGLGGKVFAQRGEKDNFPISCLFHFNQPWPNYYHHHPPHDQYDHYHHYHHYHHDHHDHYHHYHHQPTLASLAFSWAADFTNLAASVPWVLISHNKLFLCFLLLKFVTYWFSSVQNNFFCVWNLLIIWSHHLHSRLGHVKRLPLLLTCLQTDHLMLLDL